jgi:hypothetical protein
MALNADPMCGILLRQRGGEGQLVNNRDAFVTIRALSHIAPSLSSCTLSPGGQLHVEINSKYEVFVTIPAGVKIDNLSLEQFSVPEGIELQGSTGMGPNRLDAIHVQAGVPVRVTVPYAIVRFGPGHAVLSGSNGLEPFFDLATCNRYRPNVPDSVVSTAAPPRMTEEQRLQLQEYLNIHSVQFDTVNRDFITETVNEAFQGTPAAIRGMVASAWHAWLDREEEQQAARARQLDVIQNLGKRRRI